MGEINLYKTSVGKPEGKSPLRRPAPRWENDIKTDLRDIKMQDVHWIHLA
jgi:hypothetical protein